MTSEQFKTTRKAFGASQAHFAHILRISRRQIIRYETGESDIPGPVSVLLEIMTTRKMPNLRA